MYCIARDDSYTAIIAHKEVLPWRYDDIIPDIHVLVAHTPRTSATISTRLIQCTHTACANTALVCVASLSADSFTASFARR